MLQVALYMRSSSLIISIWPRLSCSRFLLVLQLIVFSFHCQLVYSIYLMLLAFSHTDINWSLLLFPIFPISTL
ncbi:hypothetical protein DL95DRAFT_152169 [Leptodontidium sp. 2 PMI_412]|nr:hypothetical protein DL95DRAFT_152169 [Leptodontidium sp. 2 PMI_412]